MDSEEFGRLVVEALCRDIGDHLRSVVGYTRDNYAVHYIRDDIADSYTDAELEDAIDEMRLETLEQNYLNSVFQARHGEVYCRVVVFSEAVEMNFAVNDGVGLAVAIDTDYFARTDNVVKEILALIEEHSEWELGK